MTELDDSALLLSPTNYKKAVGLQDTYPDDVCPGCQQTIDNTFRFRRTHDQSHIGNMPIIRCSWTLDHLAARTLTRQMIQHTNNHNTTP